MTTPLPRVCVNPEILKILGYSNQISKLNACSSKCESLEIYYVNIDCGDYYYANNNNNNNNNRVPNNPYGVQVVIDPQTGLPLMSRTNEIHQQSLGGKYKLLFL